MPTGFSRFRPLLVPVLVALLLTGARTTYSDSGPRVISLAPHLTELVFAAGAGDRLVGVIAHSDWPPEAGQLPRIGDAFRLDMERIVALEPDLALAWQGGTALAAANHLEQFSIELVWIDIRRLDQIADAIEQIGNRLGTPVAARQSASSFRDRLRLVPQAGTDEQRVTVFYQISARPLYTLGGRHLINEIFERCGARNLFAELDTEAAVVDREVVLAGRPDLVLAGTEGRDNPVSDPLEHWRQAASRHDWSPRLATIDATRLMRPTPRILEGIEQVCALTRAIPTAR
ncbi:MAG: cobalamin-binding protein [Pseudomonadota bacterium]|nr:MAG: cobalamin-binding protein [Pseudomonadota bacterium]